jgi:hypothetical protein
LTRIDRFPPVTFEIISTYFNSLMERTSIPSVTIGDGSGACLKDRHDQQAAARSDDRGRFAVHPKDEPDLGGCRKVFSAGPLPFVPLYLRASKKEFT